MKPLIIGEYYTVIDKLLPNYKTRRWHMKVTGYNVDLSCFEIKSSLAGDSIYLANGQHFKNSLIIEGTEFPFKTEIDFGISAIQPVYFFITTDYEGLRSILLEKCISLSNDLLMRIYYRPYLPSDRRLWWFAPFERLF
ncbi:hypothetical protein [Filimonas effusa]|uniref:Uncharacterized protein n=1 Tax=Filimonas effusa TaxID=2508721 RepID=A0A4V1M9H4_9BACT|nr:hypothetical protein [Filimonas effusa]RXK81158.1 hypothetical protein ESB13_19650 [Filimonas effusa]